jgi:tRNA 2-thiouridine synthesizing protein A
MALLDPVRTIDARGHRCPTPTLKLRRAVAETAAGGRVRLVCDDPLARIDVPHFASEAGLDLIETTESEGVFSFTVAVR